MFDIKEQVRKLPEKPGVYLMKDKYGNIIYVGKSKSLKKRVSSYFRGFNSHAPKVQSMIINIEEFEYIMTDTEVEALILEANLIKKYHPKFNILLRDDKQYPYIKITTKDKYPRVFMTRLYYRDGNRYFGPFTSVDAVKKTIEVLNKIYPFRQCSKKIEGGKERPCLNFHIGKCMGPCTGEVDPKAYTDMIEKIIRFLSGKDAELIAELQAKMHEEAEKLNFEKAADLRNQVMALKSLTEKQKIVSTSDVNQDVIALDIKEGLACVMMFIVRGGKLLGREEFIFEEVDETQRMDILSSFLLQYYSGANFIPGEILLESEVQDGPLMEKWLSEKAEGKVVIAVPKRGEKKKMMDMVKENAIEYLEKFTEKIRREIETKNILSKQLKSVIGEDVHRIEAYDISNLYGVYSVGSLVVFEGGKKKKSDYRRFKIKRVQGANDYASMREIINRRFVRGLSEIEKIKAIGLTGEEKFSVFPDLLLIDGGKGHVNVVLDELNKLGIDIPVAGMVKDDYHRTDKLYYQGEFYDIKLTRQLFKFVTEIQDEVHRFAIDHHKSLRTKAMTYSVLEEIDGVGKSRRIELIKHFKSIDNIKKATLEEIQEVNGINRKVAENVYNFFREVEDE